MRASNLPPDLNDSLFQQVELPAQRDKLLGALQTKIDRLETGLRGSVALIIVYVALGVFSFFMPGKAWGRVADMIFIALIGLTLLLTRDDAIKMKRYLRELKSLIRQCESSGEK
ncbi:MAG: hypothetical protein M3362_17145 [Acidobacteriota bacterium]|nr:hypothetical protein [Acidobacteriota bacterium]